MSRIASQPSPPPVAVASRRGWLTRRRRVTALDLDGDMLRVVQAAATGGGTKVTRYAATQLEGLTAEASPAERGRAIGAALERLRVRPGRVVLGLPRAQVLLRSLSLPGAADPGELAAMVHYQVGRELPFPAAEAEIDFKLQPAGETGASAAAETTPPPVRVLAAVVKRSLLAEYQEMGRAAGLKLAAIGLRSHANARCVELGGRDATDRCVAMVSLRSDEVIIDVVSHGALAFSRVGAVTSRPAHEDAAARAEYVQEVLLEVVRAVHNYEGLEEHAEIGRFFVAGSTGAEQAVVDMLSRRFDAPGGILDPVSIVGLKRVEGNGATGAQAAFGLALSYLDPGGLPFDFLHPKRPVVRRDNRRTKRLAFAALAALGFLVLTGVRTHLIRGRLAEKAAVQTQLNAANRNVKAYRATRIQARTVREWETGGHRWLDHLALLSALLPPSPDIYVSSFSTGSRDSLTLAVKARSGEILNQLDDALRAAGYDVGPSAITPTSDRYGYGFQSSLELTVPTNMAVQLGELSVPDRPADDASLAAEAPVVGDSGNDATSGAAGGRGDSANAPPAPARASGSEPARSAQAAELAQRKAEREARLEEMRQRKEQAKGNRVPKVKKSYPGVPKSLVDRLRREGVNPEQLRDRSSPAWQEFRRRMEEMRRNKRGKEER